MSRQKFVMGNWKMHGTQASVHALLQHLKSIQPASNETIVVFPPFIYLEKTSWELRSSQIKYGAQNLSQFANGAFTGEVSATMLVDAGCDFVLIGHSERRQLFAEDNQLIAKKFMQATQAGLRPVLCLGETHEQRLHKQTAQVVLAQLQSVLDLPVSIEVLAQMVVAYEPVWAIGTGLTATPHQAQEVHQLLREALTDHHESLMNLPIVYGGSVKASNAKSLFTMADIDGALIGGASLDAEEFRTICHTMR